MAQNFNIGTAHGTIIVNSSSVAAAGAQLDMLGGKFIKLGLVAAAGFGFAVKAAADYETQLDRFDAVSGATTKQMDQIREAGLRLGREAGIGPKAVIEGFVEIAKAGLTAEEVLGGVGEAAVQLAAAGELEMNRATEILVNTMRIFNVPAKEAIKTVNLIAGAANASTIDVEDFATSMRYVGPVAASAGVSLESTAEAIAVLGNAGIKGSTAGTSLRGIILGIAASTPAAREAMRTLGLETANGGNKFFDAAGKMRSFSDISEILRGALGGVGKSLLDTNGKLKSQDEINKLLADSTLSLTQKQKIQAVATIFQRRAMASALQLANEGAAGFDKLRKSNQFATTAAEIMRTKLDNLNGDLKRLWASLQTVAIMLGETMMPYLRSAAQAVERFLFWVQSLSPETKTWIMRVIGLSAALLIAVGVTLKVVAAYIKVRKALKDASLAFKVLGSDMKVLFTNPWFLALAALAAIAVAFYLAYTRSEKFREIVNSVLEWLQGAFEWTRTAAEDALGWIKEAWPEISAAISTFWSYVQPIFSNFIARIMAIANIVKNVVELVVAIFEGDWKAVWENFKQIVAGALEYLFLTFIELPLKILELVGKLAILLIPIGLDLIWGLLKGIVQAAFDVWYWFNVTLPLKILEALAGIGLWLLNKGIDLIMGLLNGVKNNLTELLFFFTFGLPGAILGALSGIDEWLVSAGVRLVTGLWNGIKSMGSWIGDKVGGFVGGVADKFKSGFGIFSPSRVTAEMGRYLVLGLAKGIQDNLNVINRAVGAMQARVGVGMDSNASMLAAGVQRSYGVGADYRGAQTVARPGITQHVVIQALDAREAAKALERERVWAEQTSGV